MKFQNYGKDWLSDMTLLINLFFCVVTIFLFLYVLKVQISLVHVYKNGLRGIRTANILTSIFLILLCVGRIIFFSVEISDNHSEHSRLQIFAYYLNSIVIFLIGIINYLYYRGYNFEIFTFKHNGAEPDRQ